MQRVIAVIGPPGAGKSTFTETLDPKEWITLELDQIRTSLWPPHRRKYWEIRADPVAGPKAKKLLHDIQIMMLMQALAQGWNVVLCDQHHTPATFQSEVHVIEDIYKIKIEWKVFIVPWSVIEQRNRTRPLLHRLPHDILVQEYNKVYDLNAWWRQRTDIEKIKVNELGETLTVIKSNTNAVTSVAMHMAENGDTSLIEKIKG